MVARVGFRMAVGQPVVVVMVKEPRPGLVKTRLAREIGAVAAAWWFRHQVNRLVRRIGRDLRWRLVLAVAPAGTLSSRALPSGVLRMPQSGGDLGARMAAVLRAFGPGPVLVVGADVPGIDADRIARALGALKGKDAVLGPATDGGYWLVGLRRAGAAVPAGLFLGVRWSGPHALADTLETMGGMRVGWADTLADVDTAADLARSS